ncbi:hypothetical protein DRN98_07330, partial [Methanosarcinales archaeon]
MRIELENFLRVLELRVAHTTFMRKAWQIKSFYKFLLYHNRHFTEVKKETVEKYLRSFNCSRGARQQLCFVISEFYDFVKFPNPAKEITFRKDTSKELPKVPSQQVIRNIIRNLSAEDTVLSLRNRLIVELAYGSGLRRMELVKLNIDDIGLENRTLFVNGKGGKNRIMPLTEKAVYCIREYLGKRRAWTGPLLVSFTGRRLSFQAVYQILKQKLGIRPHQLRHACAGHMLKNGCDI